MAAGLLLFTPVVLVVVVRRVDAGPDSDVLVGLLRAAPLVVAGIVLARLRCFSNGGSPGHRLSVLRRREPLSADEQQPPGTGCGFALTGAECRCRPRGRQGRGDTAAVRPSRVQGVVQRLSSLVLDGASTSAPQGAQRGRMLDPSATLTPIPARVGAIDRVISVRMLNALATNAVAT